ncbi:hypothetical protein DICSQDRAFT_165150 [Dichomitus squalens LYAD-421 SS1]|uniref:uncharacterized protein n=1 Tax=Dichomitus squalens (strain LYAD-421) TaxID=732165 RepID=UPI00044141C0|nr:uncharacterized protein DICSQDRAFT_165150 [Dichomitus squalens LYAD-421 SS1]EJF67326.1 hypothetical protein DICSQDRAFT_165150 [Dichomitus squalens LYAD-421 SS1]
MADRGTQNVQRLNGTVAAIEDLQRTSEKHQASSSKVILVLWEAVKALQEELKITTARLVFVESVINIEEENRVEGDGDEGAEAARGSTGTGEASADPVQASINAATQQSRELVDGKIVKDVVNATYMHLLGISALAKKNIPGYPQANEEWPTDAATGRRLLRFKWNVSVKDPVNAVGIATVKDTIRASGAERDRDCAPYLPKILDAHLLDRIATKFHYMAKQHKNYQTHDAPSNSVGDGGEGGHGDDDGFGGEREEQREGSDGEGEVVRMQGAGRRARAVAVAAQRQRKAKGTEWGDPKYAAAFVVNAQSDNEDEYKDGERPAGTPIRFRRRRPGWRSALLQRLYQEVDARKDPAPDQARMMVERVLGADLEKIKPPKAQLKYRVRAWMVKDEILQANPDWMESRRVARNGKLWGDEEDPVEDLRLRTPVLPRLLIVTDVGQTPLFAAHSPPLDAHLPFSDHFLS